MKPLLNLTLGKKIGLLTAIGLVLAVVAFSLIAMRAVNQATEAMLEDRMTTAHLVADYLDETLGRALTELGKTAQAVSIEQPGAAAAEISALEQTFSRISVYTEGLYLVGGEGRIIWSQPGKLDGIDLSFYPGIRQALDGEANISGAVISPAKGTAVVMLSSPVGSAQAAGALVATVDLARSGVGGVVHPVRLGETGYVEVVDSKGVVILRTQPGPKLAPFEKSDHSGHFAELIAAGQPARGLCHTCHEPVQKVERRDMLAFVPLSETRWGVAIRQSEDEALAPIRELGQNLLAFGAGLILVALLFVGLTTRDVVGQIRMLTGAARRIASGDLTRPLSIRRRDELGVLAESFEEMRVKLRNSYRELERRTEELSSLLSVSEILTSLSDLSNLDNALEMALDKTLAIMKTGIGGILLFDEEGAVLRYRVARGLSGEYVNSVCLSPGEGIAGRVARSGRALCLDDVSANPAAANPALLRAEGLRGFASVPLRSKNRVLGVLNIASKGARKFSAQDVRLLEGIARQIATAIENARLHGEVQHKDELRGELLRQVFSIQEDERRRIARELHDETCQVLASLTANLEAVSGMLPGESNGARARLRDAQSLSIRTLDEVHRIIYELRPSLLDDLGLVTAVRWLAENNLKTAGIKVSFKTVGRARRLAPQVETALFRVVQEAVNNITRHAQANNAEIILRFKKSGIEVSVRDDGIGFDIDEVISARERPRGLGLLGMKERIEIINGTLAMRSSPGEGTAVDIKIPLLQENVDGQDKSAAG